MWDGKKTVAEKLDICDILFDDVTVKLLDHHKSALSLNKYDFVRVLESKNDEFSALIISHYSKLYKEVRPSHVHVIVDGRIVVSGDYSLIENCIDALDQLAGTVNDFIKNY